MNATRPPALPARRAAAGLLLLAAACTGEPDQAGPGQDAEPTRTAAEASTTPDTASTDPAAGVAPVVDSMGIGAARRGATLSEIRDALPANTRMGDLDPLFMADLAAIPVIAGVDTLYHVVFEAGSAVEDTTRPILVATMHSRLRTAAGVGPGTTVDEAIAAYGPATLSYHTANESREFVEFERQPDGVLFRVRPRGDNATFAGEYETAGEYNTTTRYDAGAWIFMVMVPLWGVAAPLPP